MYRDVLKTNIRIRRRLSTLARCSKALAVLSKINETECESSVNKHLQHDLPIGRTTLKMQSAIFALKNVYYVD